MCLRTRSIASMAARVLQFALVSFAGTAAAQSEAGQANIFAPASTPADLIFGLSKFVLAITGVIFAVVFGLLTYAVIKIPQPGDGV